MKGILLTCTLFLCLIFANAQQNSSAILDRKLDATFSNERVSTILQRLGQAGGFSFSYNSAIIPDDQVATLDLRNKTVREILNELFKGSMNYKEKGTHIILTKVPVKQPKTAAITSMIISGYIEDAVTKEKITDASVYEKKSITSVVSDEFGFFRLKLEKKEEESLTVSISKKSYKDTTIVITEIGNQYLHVSMTPEVVVQPVIVEPQVIAVDSTDNNRIEEVQKKEEKAEEDELVIPYSTSPNVENIRDTLYRDIQVSFLPFLGTNGRLSGNVINNYSINFLGGYSLGTRNIELGFFFNMDRGDVSWLQIAGFGNADGGDVRGVQAAGFFNVNGGETKAAQLSGFTNVNFDDFQGLQLTGGSNVNLKAADGVRVAGFTNYANGNSVGAQIAGFANVQLKDFKGPQIAGFANISTGKLRGSQISGFFNYGNNVKGTQIGFINYADSLTGVPIGFLSYVHHGYHKLELSADEIFLTNVAFRSGARQFYNIIFAGFKPEQLTADYNVWTFGYGVGTARKITRWLHLNIDATTQQVNKGAFTSELSSLNKLHAGLDFKLAKKLSVYAGVTLNCYLTKNNFTDYPNLFNNYQPQISFEDNFSNSTNMKLWFGARAGIRFF